MAGVFGLEGPGRGPDHAVDLARLGYAGLGLISAIVEICRSNFGSFGQSLQRKVRISPSRATTMASHQPSPGPASMRTILPTAIDSQFCGNPEGSGGRTVGS